MKKILKKIIITMLAAAMLVGLTPTALAVDYGFDIDTACNAVLLMSLDTGEIIYEKNADERVHPASCTKIMSAALAMEMCTDLKGTIVTVPDNVWDEFDGINISTAGLARGEELSMYDCICAMMLQSGNEAASTVRDYYGGQDFIDKMNAKAAELGCTNTHFTNPHGVFSDDHYTTARDLAKITLWALDVPEFYEISQMARYDKAATNKNDAVTLVTTVLMQDPTSYYYTSYIKGVKTGTTDEAGRCLVSTAEKNGMRFLLVALGGPFDSDTRVWSQGGNSAFTDTRLIYDWAFANLSLDNVVDTNSAVAEVELKYASGKDALLVYPDSAVYTILSRSYDGEGEITYEAELPESIKAPIESGQQIGTAKVLLDGREVGSVGLISRESVPLSRFVMVMDAMTAAFKSTPAKIIYVILALLAACYIWYAVVVVRNSNKKKKRRRSSSSQRRSQR